RSLPPLLVLLELLAPGPAAGGHERVQAEQPRLPLMLLALRLRERLEALDEDALAHVAVSGNVVAVEVRDFEVPGGGDARPLAGHRGGDGSDCEQTWRCR